MAYLIRSRFQTLEKSVDESDAHKMKRGMVYRHFGAPVNYDKNCRRMQEAILESNGLETTATFSFEVDDGSFLVNVRWIDSLGHVAEFIMNANDNVHSNSQVFVNHGLDGMRYSTRFSMSKVYRTCNKCGSSAKRYMLGIRISFDGDTIIAIFEGVRVNTNHAG